jgi:hypothetical protein
VAERQPAANTTKESVATLAPESRRRDVRLVTVISGNLAQGGAEHEDSRARA